MKSNTDVLIIMLIYYLFTVFAIKTVGRDVKDIKTLIEIQYERQEESSSKTQLIQAQEEQKQEDKKYKKDSIFLLTDSFISAIIKVESNGNPNAVSPVGARGLMQIMEPTWKDMTVKEYGVSLPFDKAFDPEINRRIGVNYLHWIKRQLLKNKGLLPAEYPLEDLIAAAYNGGIGRLTRNGYDISKMPKETQKYVKKVKKFNRGY